MIQRDLAGAQWTRVATLVVPGRPLVKKNSRVLAGGSTPISLPSEAYRAWAKAATWIVMAQWRQSGSMSPVGSRTQPVWLRVRFVMPKGAFADLSNLYEGIQDVLQAAGVLTDDRWISSHDGSRRVDTTQVGGEARLEAEIMLPVGVVPVRGSVV